MNPAQLLIHFDRISEAPNAIPRLRRFIRDLAVRGKLVEQDPKDESASELLKRIHAEKVRLVKNASIRKQEPTPQVEIEDQPFDLPTNWQWVRFGAIADFSAGRTPSRHDFSFWNTGDYPWVSIADMRDGGVVVTTKETVSPKAKNQVFRSEPVPVGTLIMSFKLTIGKISRLGVPAFHNEAIISIHPHLPAMDDYFFEVLPQLSRQGDTKDAIKGATLNRDSIANILLPLPPLAEQQRIIAKVDELMALCDRLEASQAERESQRDRLAAASLNRLNNGTDLDAFRDHAHFYFNHLPRLTMRPEHIQKLRQTILNLAVHGKLVPQDPNDESASELLKRIELTRGRLLAERKIPKPKDLPALEDIELPFSAPAGWEWTFLGKLCFQVSDGPHYSPQYVSPDSGVPFLSTRNVRADRFDLNDLKYVSKEDHERFCKRIRPEQGDILYTKGGTTGIARVNDLDFEFSVWVHLAVLRVAKEFLAPQYVALALNSALCYDQSQAYTQGISNFDLGLTRMIKIVIPFPPLAEQQHIVAKVDELMALCDRLEAQLTITQTESGRLLEAVLHEALAPAM